MGGLTDEQETFLANLVERARERAKRAWKITEGFSRATVDEAFDSGFGEAMEFAVSDEFAELVARLKAMLTH
jgi:hypothetical protein